MFNSPRIRTHDGILYVEAGGSGKGTISFAASAIKIGNDDLMQTINVVSPHLPSRKNSKWII